MWAAHRRLTEDLGNKERQGGQAVGGPGGASRKWAATYVMAHFLSFSRLKQTNPTRANRCP